MGFASVAAENKTLLWDSTNSVAVGTATHTNRWEGAQSSSSLNSHVCAYVSSWSPPGSQGWGGSYLCIPKQSCSQELFPAGCCPVTGGGSSLVLLPKLGGTLAASKSCSLGPSSAEDAAGMTVKARRQI